MKAFLAFLLGLLLVSLVVMSLAQVRAAQPVQPEALSQANLLPLGQTAKLIASDGVGDDNLGYSVAASEDTIVVGAFGDDSSQGSAYVFVKPSGGWEGTLTQTAKLVASDGASDLFGFAVAIRGETIVVGAPRDNGSRGSAYVFVKPSGGWNGVLTETAKLTAADGAGGDNFAGTVAIDGDTLAVGTPIDTVGANSQQGSVYIFVRPGGGWVTTSTFTAKLTASDGTADDAFGSSVTLRGETLVVGAPGFPTESDPDAAYIFVKPSGGWVTTSTFAAKLTASDGIGTDVFGFSAALSNDIVVVGAPDDDSNQGSAYLFVKPGSGWSGTLTETAKLTSSEGVAGDRFGLSLAAISDTVIVGAPGDDSGQGSIYSFVQPGGGWVTTSTFTAKLTASDGTVNNFFGFSMAASGETVVIGAQGNDGNRGSAYVFGSRSFLYLPIILR